MHGLYDGSSDELIALASERATLGESGLTTSRLAEHRRARAAENDSLRVREHRSDIEATLALDVHEERVRRLNQSLELVLARLERGGRVQEIDVLREHLRSDVRERACG